MTNVVCIKWGKLYGPEYVNILHAMLRRNATVPFRFVCFTENRDGVDKAIETRPLPYLLQGWWNKIPLFAPPQCIADDQIVAVDLDVVITANIDWLLNHRGRFCGVKAYSPVKYNGSLWSLEPGCYTNVWENFIERGAEIVETFYSDQEWITDQIPGGDYFQDFYPGTIRSFNVEYWIKSEEDRLKALTPETSIWLLHGIPKPFEASKQIPWVKENWRI